MIHCLLIVGTDRHESGLAMLKSAQHPSVRTYVVWRGLSELPSNGLNIHFQCAVEECSLSKGRNILLKEIYANICEGSSDIICLADDDGLWPENLVENINVVFETKALWALGTYGPTNEQVDRDRFPPEESNNLNLDQVLQRASSLGLYVRADVAKSVGYFDEKLGLGTNIEIGEDTDFILRVINNTKEINYRPSLYQIHPYGRESSRIRLIHSLNFYLHIKSKEEKVSKYFFRRLLNLLISRQISTPDAIRFIKAWFLP